MNLSLYQKRVDLCLATQFDVNDWDFWKRYVKWVEPYDGYYLKDKVMRVEDGSWVLFSTDAVSVPIDVMSNEEFEQIYKRVNVEKETDV
jgi:hypothetical protein